MKKNKEKKFTYLDVFMAKTLKGQAEEEKTEIFRK